MDNVALMSTGYGDSNRVQSLFLGFAQQRYSVSYPASGTRLHNLPNTPMVSRFIKSSDIGQNRIDDGFLIAELFYAKVTTCIQSKMQTTQQAIEIIIVTRARPSFHAILTCSRSTPDQNKSIKTPHLSTGFRHI